MKLIPVLLLLFNIVTAQKIDSIFVNLYTDSLRKGTFNYINIDGMSSGRYIPLDSSDIRFDCSHGKFVGNNLWIPENSSVKSVAIKASLKTDPKIHKSFSLPIKQMEDPPLKSEAEVLNEMKTKSKVKNKRKD